MMENVKMVTVRMRVIRSYQRVEYYVVQVPAQCNCTGDAIPCTPEVQAQDEVRFGDASPYSCEKYESPDWMEDEFLETEIVSTHADAEEQEPQYNVDCPVCDNTNSVQIDWNRGRNAPRQTIECDECGTTITLGGSDKDQFGPTEDSPDMLVETPLGITLDDNPIEGE